jgi:hypothetical protein
VLDSTAKSDDLPMGPGTPPFFLAHLVWGSVFLEYLSRFSLIPSRLNNTITLNAISEAYERHLRKPQNASFPNQYLQEQGGETTASLSSAIYMADPSSSNKEQALVIVVPVGLPPELHQCAPEYFLLVDSGATVHCLWDAMCTSHLKEQNSSIGWGGVGSRSVCIATGRLCGVTFCRSKSNNWSKVLITSGTNDAWVIPTSARMLFSQVRSKKQGHRSILDGPNPGLIIGDTGDFVPLVIEEETQFCMFPMYPPPTSSARHAGLYSSSMRVLNLEGSGKSSSKAHALIFNPLVSKILLKRSALKRASQADIKQRKLLQVESRRIQKEKQRLLQEKRRLVEEKRLIRDQANRTNYLSYHRRCGHASMKSLITFKRNGKVTASRLPPKDFRNYRKDCPICVAMKMRRKSLPKGSNSAHVLDQLVPWEEVFTDSSGKFRRKSKQGNNYFTVFVCAKTGDRIAIPHVKRKHFPLVYFEFTKRIGRHPKVLYSDLASEITSSMFERYLLVKGVNHVNVPRGEHHSIGVAEKAIQDLSNMMRCMLADSNVPNIYWDFVIEHAALVNSMITPSISDKTKTIFETVWDAIPNIDLEPPVGCFCARLMDNSAREDRKLDAKNQSGVFLGFAHRRNIYGAQILVDKAIITAKHQIAYDVELFPFQQRDNSNDRMQFLQSLLKRKTAPISDSALDNDYLNSDATTPYPNSIVIDDSSDDEQVTNLMQDVDNLSKVPPFNILDSETRRSDVSLHVPPKANPNVDEEFTASPSQRRSSRHRRYSLNMDASESPSSKPIAKRSKVIDKASTAKSLTAPIITTDTLRVTKSLLIGKKLRKYFSGFGGAIGTVTDYILDHDAYRLEYSDGHVDIIPFSDILKLLPKTWSKPRQSSDQEDLVMSGESVLEDILFVHVEAAALIAHITSNSAPSNATQFTCPKDYAHAIDPERSPDYRLWLEATRKEYELLDKTMGCWEVVDIDTLPQDANLIGVKWVFKLKYKNGEYERHKARIVALGYQQRKNVDFFASFSPTASYVTIKLVLALTALPHWYGVDLDATGAFISAPLPPEEQVYLKGIPGYDLPKGKCLRLKKTIYGLVQAPLSYFKLCKEVYAKVGLRQLDCDECVFVKYSQNIKGQPPLSVENILESGAFMTMDTVPENQRVCKSCIYPVACIIIVMHVDNNGVRHNWHELLAEFQSDVAKDGRIDLHLEGDMSSFLSVRYLNNTETGEITADQEAYIDTLLAKYNMTECNPKKVPLKTSVNLDEIAARLSRTPHPEVLSLYAQLVGEFMFVAINTQPLIAQTVNALARFMTTANSELYVLAKGVLRYLKGVKSRKIVWCASHVKFPFVPCEIYAYSDASWADIVPQRKSSLSYLIFCNNAVFSWKSSLSSVLAMSSAEADLIALCACAADVAYCRKLANELGFLQLRPTIIHEDDLGAKQIAESGNFKGRSRHFELRWRFLHHYINRGIVSIKAIKRELQLADLGTAPRGYPQLQQMGAVIHGEI